MPLSAAPLLVRNAVTVAGEGSKPLVFLHGYGCDQTMWRHIAPHFAHDYRLVLYDLTGSGRSDLSAYDRRRHGDLYGHAADLIELCDALELTGADIAAHSVGCMIALLAARQRPDLFGRLMLLGPSPCYQNLPGYNGGFSRQGIDELLGFLDINLAAWSANLAPMVMANAERPELAVELEGYFVRNDPDILRHFARVVFLSDYRQALDGIRTPCLIMQCADDIIAPGEVGDFLKDRLPNSDLVVLDTHGHYPHLSAPGTVAGAMEAYLDTRKAA